MFKSTVPPKNSILNHKIAVKIDYFVRKLKFDHKFVVLLIKIATFPFEKIHIQRSHQPLAKRWARQNEVVPIVPLKLNALEVTKVLVNQLVEFEVQNSKQ